MAQYLNRRDALHLDLRYGTTPRVPSARAAQGSSRRSLPAAGSRGVVVKSWMGSPATTGAHVRYLTQGKGTDGTDTTLFGPQGFVRDPHAFIREAQQDGHQFRWVVSVVDADQLSLIRYTQALMRQVEADTHRPLDWVAATHRDTMHVHTHLVVRGRDRDGRSLYLPLFYLSHRLRDRATDLATGWLGRVPVVERDQHRTATHAVATAMRVQAAEAKHPKEDPRADEPPFRDCLRELVPVHHLISAFQEDRMMEANHPTQLDADTSADAPPSQEPTPAQPDPAGLMARLVALQAMIQQRLQVKAQSQDRGLEV
jgi:hypothetical protein